MPLAVPAPSLFNADELLPALLDLSLTGVVLYTPLYDAEGAIVDFAFTYLNPAAQRMLNLPAKPAQTFCERVPQSRTNGSLDFNRDTYLSGQPGAFELLHEEEGYKNYFKVAARRVGELLLVSFTDTADYPRKAIEQALRESQDREQRSHTLVAGERNLLQAVLAQAPVAIGLLRGDEQVVAMVNEPMCAVWGYPAEQVLNKPLLEGVPELEGQGFKELLDEVARTQVPFVGKEMPAKLLQQGRLETHYFNFVYQPLYDVDGSLLGVLDIATDVTEQVLARQEMQNLNEELATINEELQTSNEEFLQTNTELLHAQEQLRELNNELEARVLARTRQLETALLETEQQREKLREQQALLQHIMGEMPAAIATMAGPEHHYTYFNANYQQFSGGRVELGKTAADVFPEVVEQGFMALMDKVYATGEPLRGVEAPAQVYNPETSQLEQRYVDFVYQPMVDRWGQTYGLLNFVLDVTEKVLARQQTEALQAEVLAAAQRQAQEREAFYEVFERTPACVAMLRGPEHLFAYVNPAYQALFPGRALEGHTFAEALPETTTQGFVALLDQVYETGETYFGTESAFVQTGPDGQSRTHHFNFTYQVYQENRGKAGVSIFAYEVTDQVLARRQRVAQQQQLERLFMQAPAAICILDGPELVYELANPGYQALFPGRQLLGRRIAEALPEIVDHPVYALFLRVYQTGTTNEEKEILVPILNSENGHLEDRYFNFTQQARFNEEGRVDGILVFAFEVTEQVLARQQVQGLNEELADMNEELAAINEELQATNDELGSTNTQLTRTNVDLDNFIYTASHDLRAPISNIEGLLLVLRQHLAAANPPAGMVQRVLGLMQHSVERFQQTIGHLTDISRLQQAHSQPAEMVDLAVLVESICLDLAPALEAAGAELRVDVAACPPVSFSPKNLRSIVYNLLSNAVKYHAPDRPPLVQLRCRTRGASLVLEVQDNGLGLSATQQTKLFSMFQRLHDHVEGSGIGLYMVKKIVENAGGTITVESELGVGTTFMVSLPL